MITKEDVIKVAALSKIELTDEEVDKYVSQLTEVLRIVGDLNKVDTQGVEPLYSPLEKTNYFRSDIVEDSNLTDKILESSPQLSDEGNITTPQVVG